MIVKGHMDGRRLEGDKVTNLNLVIFYVVALTEGYVTIRYDMVRGVYIRVRVPPICILTIPNVIGPT